MYKKKISEDLFRPKRQQSAVGAIGQCREIVGLGVSLEPLIICTTIIWDLMVVGSGYGRSPKRAGSRICCSRRHGAGLRFCG